jgi:hypothetical protein
MHAPTSVASRWPVQMKLLLIASAVLAPVAFGLGLYLRWIIHWEEDAER